jgi:hypothetical protein
MHWCRRRRKFSYLWTARSQVYKAKQSLCWPKGRHSGKTSNLREEQRIRMVDGAYFKCVTADFLQLPYLQRECQSYPGLLMAPRWTLQMHIRYEFCISERSITNKLCLQSWVVYRKLPVMVGRLERTLAIDGDHIHVRISTLLTAIPILT